MSESYDVVVAGAGPAGAQCARDLATRGHDVVLLETEAEAEFPRASNKSTAGTFPSTMTTFNVPDEVVMNYTDDVVIESPNDYYKYGQTGAVLEFADFKNWLVDEGRAEGAEVQFDARVSRPLMEGGEIAGVVYNGDEEIRADIVVDATGPSAPLARKLGIADLKREHQAIGIEYEFTGIDTDADGYADVADAMMLRLDHDIAPGGYSWIFHTGEDTAKVGVCYLQNGAHSDNAREGFTIDDYLEYWLDNDPRFAEAEPIEGKQHRGSAHIQMPTSLSTDNFMAVGDTVPTLDPLWGEGIDKCMRSGRAAAATADSCLTHRSRDTSAHNMAVYDRLWHRDVAPDMRKRLVMTELLYLSSNDRYDDLIADLNDSDAEIAQNANRGNLLSMLHLLKREDVPVLARYARMQLERRFDFL
ncbi:digeranylgeranylglycerophospholipid reductase [Halogranum amylolyticum]|uniref:Digeranylgeranylglycerophospholipid reductase n=1 Tax=Halogranum amylolyticum TaxID=660520 RepID=A0A1H8UTG5_9EURY|nr:digeranylgeranylglycerophospholipid reductase [Halogranum amylolyticum]SEP06461.1 digeranylgeranylglycerophospholipid reductase [Halogranum amylolyticum]